MQNPCYVFQEAQHIVCFKNTLRIGNLSNIKKLESLKVTKSKITFDFKSVTQIDISAAFRIQEIKKNFESKKIVVQTKNLKGHAKNIFLLLEKNPITMPTYQPMSLMNRQLYAIGEYMIQFFEEAKNFLIFLGAVVYSLVHIIRHPKDLPLSSLSKNMYDAGVTAIPIVMLISFVIGAVLAYEGLIQLGKFGAKVFTVNLVSYSMLREVGILLTSVVVAGRTSSAYAAAIGTMKLNEEIDALKILGLQPMQVLVIPRILALVILLPILVFISDIVGLLGGAIVCSYNLDMTVINFFEHLRHVVTPSVFWVGVAKAPVFGIIIGVVGCMQGFQAHLGAASVGDRTTRAVVTSIFLVIVLNGLISISLTYLGY